MSDRYDSYDASLDRDLDAEAESEIVASLSPELRAIYETAKGRAEAAGYLVPDEVDEATVPEPPVTRRGVDALACVYCGAAIPSVRLAYRKVVGWERLRQQGGTNAVRLREQLDKYACSTCVDAVAAGRDPGQAAML